ncbi:arrestin domain-containing protein 5-like isoform X2 [Episyrphus balteatus]|nr:arrestin domain-containing protein 5-like isoform X2 [Episyrphus balteatus]
MDGYALAEWNSSKKTEEKPKIVKGRDDFIASTTYLVGSEESTSILVAAGNYAYNFSCNIPEKCPSSYNSMCGHIRYQMTVILDYGNKTEEILKESFHVIKQLDLRPQSSTLKLPVDMEVFESKCFYECWKTPLCLYVNLPQGGFVPGETISVYARLINDGKIPLKSISISLNQVVTFTSKTPRQQTLSERYNMVQNLSSLAGNAPLREFLERIPIPSVPPSTQENCTTLRINYEVEVSVDHVKGKREVVARIPIVIGTIPIDADGSPKNNNDRIQVEVSDPKAFATSIISSCSMESLNTKSDSRTPDEVILNANASTSFQEASFMSSTNLNKKDKNALNKDVSGFKPKYLYYELNEDIEMTPTTMEITKEITIAST